MHGNQHSLRSGLSPWLAAAKMIKNEELLTERPTGRPTKVGTNKQTN
jgi:hypothetical protein